MSGRHFGQFIAIVCYFICHSATAMNKQLERLIMDASRSNPAMVVDKLKQATRDDFQALSSEALIKASHAAASKIDIGLTIQLTEILLARANQQNSAYLSGNAYYNRGAVYAYAGHHDQALDAFLLALPQFESSEDTTQIARIKGALALMYVEIGEYELAKPYFKESIDSHRAQNQLANLAMSLQNRGFLKIKLRQFDSAEKDLQEALQISHKEALLTNYPIVYKNLGIVAAELGKTEVAFDYFNNAIEQSDKLNLKHYQSEIEREFARVHMRLKNLEQARKHINHSIEIGQEHRLLKQLRASQLLLAELEVEYGNYKEAYLAKEKALKLSEQMGDSKIAANLSRLDRYTTTIKEQSKRELLEKENKIANLAAEREQLLRNFSISVAVIAIMAAIYFVRRFTHTKGQAVHFEQQSKIDSLTGVWNRRAGEAQLTRLCKRDMGGVKVFSIAMLDIDHFKNVNDQFGHDVGDKVIISVCNIIQESLRPTDMLCRWGGEEFVLILESFDSSKAFDICERIRQNISSTNIKPIGKLTVSIGISMFQDDELFELVKRGDQALYHAKHLGRNRVIVKNKASYQNENNDRSEGLVEID